VYLPKAIVEKAPKSDVPDIDKKKYEALRISAYST